MIQRIYLTVIQEIIWILCVYLNLCDKSGNERDYSVVSDLKHTSASHFSDNELVSMHVTTSHCDRILNKLDSDHLIYQCETIIFYLKVTCPVFVVTV